HHVYELLTERNRKAKGESEQQRKFRQAKAEAEYAQAVGELSHMVLGPVAGQLFNKRLLIVSDGALQYIPFAVLSLPQAPLSKLTVPLVAEHEIVNLPSASVLAVLRREQMQRKQATKMVAVLADPVFVPKDERVTLATNNGPATRPNAGEGHPSASQPDPLGLEAPEESDLDRSAKQLGVSGFPRLPFTRR